ncbi:MFS transporter [Variovorax sp. RA8]|uniref:MFS transporter n=1 Tax=Variovorax sp. (strain JCM 16519 / RA8) TaxID=662548 RepID=UPI0013162E78|nr:MFS transporter [Variovorax sp. RA8]VTU29672.1 Purine efflux pump PbuE [Variovorax sp. RA8]
MTTTDTGAGAGLASTRRALLFGNFVIGAGLQVVAGTLQDLSRSLGVSVATAGQLISIAAVVVCVAAPFAAWFGRGRDMRRLLALALLWYGIGHAACAAATGHLGLGVARALSMLAAAFFTPQAAAAMVVMSPPRERASAIAFIFIGWSASAVIGAPVSSFVGEVLGWRHAFGLIAGLALLAAAVLWRSMPSGVKTPPVSAAAWKAALRDPALMAVVLVTALQGAGQFTVLSYFLPFCKQVLQATAAQVSLAYLWFGALGVTGNVLLVRLVGRMGPGRSVNVVLCAIAASLACWPLVTTMPALLVVIVPWALACFASNSAQQARLGHLAPQLTPALMAMNTSAIYLGQALGAAGGGALLASNGMGALSWAGLAWMLAALALSLWAARRIKVHGLRYATTGGPQAVDR